MLLSPTTKIIKSPNVRLTTVPPLLNALLKETENPHDQDKAHSRAAFWFRTHNEHICSSNEGRKQHAKIHAFQ